MGAFRRPGPQCQGCRDESLHCVSESQNSGVWVWANGRRMGGSTESIRVAHVSAEGDAGIDHEGVHQPMLSPEHNSE